MRKVKKSNKRLTVERMAKVCDQLALGKSLRGICDSSKEMPHFVTVLQAVQRDEKLYEMYAKARAIGAEVLADELHDLAELPIPAELDPKLSNAWVQRQRLEVDTKKWTFSKMQPRGVRHKKEDVDNSGGIVLVWGESKPEPKVVNGKAKVIENNG